MTVRELIEALSVGDPDAEVYVAFPGETGFAPLERLDDVAFEDGLGDDSGDDKPLGLVLWPAASRRRPRAASADLALAAYGHHVVFARDVLSPPHP